MRYTRGFERKKGNIQRDLIGDHLTLSTTNEIALGTLRDLTCSINHVRVGEA